MNIKINLTMDSNVLMFSIVLIIIFSLVITTSSVDDTPLITVEKYNNTCEKTEYPTYWIEGEEYRVVYWIKGEQQSDRFWGVKNVPTKPYECCYPIECYEILNLEEYAKCDCIYPIVCGTLEELGLG